MTVSRDSQAASPSAGSPSQAEAPPADASMGQPKTDMMRVEPEFGSHLTMAESEIPVLPVLPLSRPSVLQQVRGPLAPQVFELDKDTMVVGRADDAEISVPSTALSRRHMRIERHVGGHRIFDLDSANGIYLNEVRIHSAVLRDGDALQLGNAVFIYHEGK